MIIDNSGEFETEIVDCVASGYEWVCPQCDYLNKEIEWGPLARCNKCNYDVELSWPYNALA